MSGPSIDSALATARPRLERIVAGFGFGRHDIEDLLGDVCVRALEHDAARTQRDDATGWLIRITVNRCLEEIRRRKREQAGRARYAVEQETQPGQPASADEDEIDIMRSLLRELDERLAVPLVLGYFCRMRSAEIGDLLSQPAATIRTRQREARLLLAKQLRARGVQP